ncbi:MAG: iron-containing alcohol dehydrogenase, partial [Lentisphaeria bacterium]|nr:iron-containing alcohol dehydrogenase [Lentisphaeria bacterium]
MSRSYPDKGYIAALEAYEPTTIVFGNGAFTQLSEEALLTDCKVLLMITGGTNSSMKSGAYQAFMNMALGLDSLETPLYSGVPAEPDVEVVRDIVRKMEETRPDAVAAVGGGSVLDAAKAAYLSWQTGLDITELFGANIASQHFPEKEFKRVICIPTTSGTGSEITPYSNIVDRAKNLKFIIVEKQITPALALIDPAFTGTMDRSLTAATALDAMTHSIESLLNITAEANPEAEQWALESVRLIRFALPRVLKDPDNSAVEREMLSAAAAFGGMCIACRPTALPHLCSYSMWGKIPHGLAVALLLPHFWRYYLEGDAKIGE